MAACLLLVTSWNAESKPLLVPKWKLVHLPIVASSCRLQGDCFQVSGRIWNKTDLRISSVSVLFRFYNSKKDQVVSEEQQLPLRLPSGGYRNFSETVPITAKLDRPLTHSYYNVTVSKAEIETE